MNSLAELEIGNKAIIKQIKDKFIAMKLLELGCVVGEVITLTKKAPMGCPISFSLGYDEINLRKEEAANITVELV
jgi:ferrous iron transport protein A